MNLDSNQSKIPRAINSRIFLSLNRCYNIKKDVKASFEEPMIGEQLKKIRKQKNLTLEQVSALTSVSKPMLGQIERGRSVPTITTLWKIDRKSVV